MTMTHADAFLHDILAHPDDDAPRLIYADWLEEHGGPAGQARAEFIRVQCRLTDPALEQEQRSRLELREDRLHHLHAEEWARPLRRLVRDEAFHRGFVGEVWVKERAFLAFSDRLFRLAPVQHLHLECTPTSLSARARAVPLLASQPHLANLRSLDLTRNYLGSDGVQALVVGEHFGRLTALNLASNSIGDGGVRALCASPLLVRLTTLDLSHNDIGPTGVRFLAESLERLAAPPDGLQLRTLCLTGNPNRAAVKRIVRSSWALQRVARL